MIVSIATLGPLGKLKAPGTWGSAAGLLWWFFVVRQLATPKGWQHELAFNFLVVLMGIFFCGVAVALLKKKDPSEVVLDEFVAMPLVFLFNKNLMIGTSEGFLFVLLGFLLFRFFDILKPLGLRALEKLPGGLGVVLDDLGAALYANGCLQIACFLVKLNQ
ncbi:phosphatidylglycerophosphatase A [bacterium]|jgi:phosphatidylglycerophosphatase A|nr:phosphatidylglycerophosphatase A [bacterium]